MNPLFEWDASKARANLRKHGVNFEEAATVFVNPLSAIFIDPVHSEHELREIMVGHSADNRVLVVSFTERAGSVRIISARLATAAERKSYEESPLGGWKDE